MSNFHLKEKKGVRIDQWTLIALVFVLFIVVVGIEISLFHSSSEIPRSTHPVLNERHSSMKHMLNLEQSSSMQITPKMLPMKLTPSAKRGTTPLSTRFNAETRNALSFTVVSNSTENVSLLPPSDVSPSEPTKRTYIGTDNVPFLISSNSTDTVLSRIHVITNEHSASSIPSETTQRTTNSVHFRYAVNDTTMKRSYEPLFVLHVGPPKTGTTSLQYILKAYQQILVEDSYHYLGNAKAMGGDFTRCMNKMEKNRKEEDRKCWETFIGLLEYHRHLGHNIIVSNEVIGFHTGRNFPWSLIHGYLGKWSRVEIVVSYRHLHNFVPSAHFELQKNLRWPGPPEFGKFVTPFPYFWKFECNRTAVGSIPTPGAVKARFEAANYTVKMLDVESQDQISHFFCTILERANRTCSLHLTNSSLQLPELNQRNDGHLNYDSLALLAWQNKLLKNEQTRRYLRAKIKFHQEVTLGLSANDFPLDCLDSVQETRLLTESLQHARDCGLDTNGEAGQIFQSNFIHAKETKKFCTVNATLAFAEEKWQHFFAGAKTVW